MKIGFYTAGQPFEGDALESGAAIGGSETAFIQMARALAARGHEVLAFNSCARPGVYGGVSYQALGDSLPLLARESFDVFVVSRYFAFFNLPFKSDLKVLWNHDTLDKPRDLRAVHDEIDLFLVLSKFHRDNFLVRLPQLDDRMVVTRNGLDFALLDASASPRRDPGKVIYASRPERGLALLLGEIWPRLSRACPGLTLYVCGYNAKLEGMPAPLADTYGRVAGLMATTPNVVDLGALGKADYYRHLSEASLMLYPCVFPEVSCIAALEAQALGVPVLTSDAFALPETVVTPRTRVAGRPGSAGYVDDYVERAISLLAHRPQLEGIGREARASVRARHGWDTIAAEWERLFELGLKARRGQASPPRAPRPFPPKALLFHSGYYLERETEGALRRLGVETASWELNRPGRALDESYRELLGLIKSFQPRLALTVNHLGFDREGVVDTVFEKLKLPVASWFVDSPVFILEDARPGPYTAAFSWDSDYLPFLRQRGFAVAEYLPLAADDAFFRPQAGLAPCRDIAFVGDTLTAATDKYLRKAGLPRECLPQVDGLAARFLATRDLLPPPEEVGAILGKYGLGAGQRPAVEALVTWRASRLRRVEVLGALPPGRLTLAGDARWPGLVPLPPGRCLGAVDYYGGLSAFYQSSRVNLNVTSAQMKTGLNQRVFDAPASRAFLLTDSRDQLAALFEPGREVAVYGSPGEARDKAEWYLAHQAAREAVASAGYERVLKGHLYVHRLADLLKVMAREFG